MENLEEKIKEFRGLIYEPDHIYGGVCWCGVIYTKEADGLLHIRHREQRDTLTDFVKANFILK